MNKFDLSEGLNKAYGSMFFGMTKDHPVIGITGNYDDNACKLAEAYYKKVLGADAIPLIIPPVKHPSQLNGILDRIDALMLSGGADINPLYCGEEPQPQLGYINAERDQSELLLTRLAYNRQMPILGICRGIQTMVVALGGKVSQHIDTPIKHSQDAPRYEPTHSVVLEKDSTLYNIYNDRDFLPSYYKLFPEEKTPGEVLYVNSMHHQAVSDPGNHFRVTARAKDGIIEAIESTDMKPMIGVQWHPECTTVEVSPLIKWLADEARKYREAQRLHDRILTLDTHCDTPMHFSKGIDFSRRDDRILVDLPKMSEGRLDAIIMVCYLPQPQDGETFDQKVDFEGITPKEYTDYTFYKIAEIVKDNSQYLALARTPEELWANKRAGKKSIMLGIENGLALEGDVKNVSHFKRRGVVYITLCHNGDNDLCDSARGSGTHGGVSDFGAKVIKKMNRLGMMVDMSHAAESSFYDALQISRQPIVCSHSSARALCDHPRNLTDDQMRALAQKGGVCQITLYPGFLRTDGKATIADAIDHLNHAVSIMGVDHVGLGSDFDGDGGITGLADASELTLFTRRLLQQRYSDDDIQKIWGGNFLRVMSEVQGVRS